MYCCVKFNSRNVCFVHEGASYQFSPETISSRPSRLMSATAAVSLAPGSMRWMANVTSGGRGAARRKPPAEARLEAAARYKTWRIVLFSQALHHGRHGGRGVNQPQRQGG